MNKHLQLVRAFRDAFSLPQAPCGNQGHLSDMDITMTQAWLMKANSEVLYSLKKGDMVELLARLAGLAYFSLSAIAMLGGDVADRPVFWRHDGSVLSIMRLLSEKTNNCTSGKVEDYSALYYACARLTESFLNADFDKALEMFHASVMENCRHRGAIIDKDVNWDQFVTPDLSECLFE